MLQFRMERDQVAHNMKLKKKDNIVQLRLAGYDGPKFNEESIRLLKIKSMLILGKPIHSKKKLIVTS